MGLLTKKHLQWLVTLPALPRSPDPLFAIAAFLFWCIEILARFLYIPVLMMVLYESIINGVIGGLVTLLIGLGAWLLVGILFGCAVLLRKSVSSFLRLRERLLDQRSIRDILRTMQRKDDPVVESTLEELRDSTK